MVSFKNHKRHHFFPVTEKLEKKKKQSFKNYSVENTTPFANRNLSILFHFYFFFNYFFLGGGCEVFVKIHMQYFIMHNITVFYCCYR